MTVTPARIAHVALGLSILLLAGCAAPTHALAPPPALPTGDASPTPSATATPEPVPTPTPAPLAGYSDADPPPVITNGARDGNQVALTFDADMTTAMRAKLASGQARSYANVTVLDILDQQGIPATFFLTGMWVEQYPEVARRLAANPAFELANHTYSHRAYTPGCYTLPQLPEAEMVSEITRTFDLVRPLGGHQTNYFRFPGLCLSPAALAAIAPTHVTVIQGDVVSADPGATAAEPIVRNVLNKVRPGSIIVMHITEDNARMTDEALPDILAGLRERGLRPVRLSELLGAAES